MNMISYILLLHTQCIFSTLQYNTIQYNDFITFVIVIVIVVIVIVIISTY